MTQTICTEAEIRVILGVSNTITEEERAVINLIHPAAEDRVIEHLGYDPVQDVRTEYYPRALHPGGLGGFDGMWEPNAQHTAAVFNVHSRTAMETLQLEHIPIREVLDVRVDYDARHGDNTNAFAAADAWTQGDEFYVEWDRPNVSKSGMLFAVGSWPVEPGTVQVQYRAGYSQEELQGRARADSVAADGTITSKRVNASGIKRAVLLTVLKGMHTWEQLRKKTKTGFTPGTFKSEKLGDYSYTLGDQGEEIAGLMVSLSGEAIDELEPYVHYGSLRL